MISEFFVSLTPLAFPASCFFAGCSCEWICSLLGSPGCVAAAGMLAAVLFSMLALVNALRGLNAIRD